MDGSLRVYRGRAQRLLGAFALLVAALCLGRGDRGLAAALALVGLLLLALELRLRLDPGLRRVALGWSALGLPVLPARELGLGGLRAVELTRQRRRTTRRGHEEVFVVALDAPDPLEIWSFRRHEEARALAERIARALRSPLRDRSAGVVRERSPEALDLPLGLALRAAGAAPALPPLPAGSGIRAAEATADGAVELVLPGGRSSPAWWFLPPLLGPSLVLLGAWTFASRPVAIGATWVLGLLVAGLGAALLAARRPMRLTIGPAAVELRGLRRRRLPLESIEEAFATRDGVHLLSDRGQIVVVTASPEEALVVAALVQRAAWRRAGGVTAADRVERTEGAPEAPGRDQADPLSRSIALALGVAFTAAGGWVAARAVEADLRTRAFLDRAERLGGEVVAVRDVPGRKHARTAAVIRYRLPGHGAPGGGDAAEATPALLARARPPDPPEHRFTEEDVSTRLRAGDAVWILRDPATGRARLESEVGTAGTIGLIVFGAVFLVIGVTALIGVACALLWTRREPVPETLRPPQGR